MASSSCLMCSPKVLPARDLSSLSSSGIVPSSSTLHVAYAHPVPKPISKLAAIKCSLSEEEPAMGRRILTSVVAAGAALAVFTNMAVAAQGPGQEGARRVAEKADKLLRAADKLNIDEAPPRFGLGGGGGGEDPTRISQIAGSGLTDSSKKGLKQGLDDATKSVSEATKNVKGNTGGGFFGFGKKQVDSAVDNAKGAATTVQRKINRDGLGRFIDAAENLQTATKNTVDQAQSKANISNSGGNVLNSLQEGLQGLREGVTQSTSDAKTAVQKSVQ